MKIFFGNISFGNIFDIDSILYIHSTPKPKDNYE